MSEDMNKKVNEVIGESVGVAPEKAKSPVANSKSKWVFAGVVAVAAIAIIVEGVLLAQSKSQIELLTRQLDSAETEMNDTRSGQIELTDADAKSGISVIELTYIEEQLNSEEGLAGSTLDKYIVRNGVSEDISQYGNDVEAGSLEMITYSISNDDNAELVVCVDRKSDKVVSASVEVSDEQGNPVAGCSLDEDMINRVLAYSSTTDDNKNIVSNAISDRISEVSAETAEIETEAVESETTEIESETEAVESESEAVKSETTEVESETEAVESESEAVSEVVESSELGND